MPAPGTAGGRFGAGPPGEVAVRDALSDWRQDAALVCLLPVLCWPALIGALVTRPTALKAVLLGLLCLPVLIGLRELYAAQRVRGLLQDPGLRWTPYAAQVRRGGGMPPLLVLRGVGGEDGGSGDGGATWTLTLGPLGRRVLSPRAWPPAEPALPQSALPESPGEPEASDAPAERFVWLAGDPGPGPWCGRRTPCSWVGCVLACGAESHQAAIAVTAVSHGDGTLMDANRP